MRTLNDGFRFVLELVALGALAYWGWSIEAQTILRLAVAVVAPAVAATVWGIWVAPRSANRLNDPLRLLVEVAVFGSAAVGLVASGRPRLALAFTIAVALNLVLMARWSQR